MQAGLDVNLNNQFGTIGAPGLLSEGQPYVTEPIVEPGFNAYAGYPALHGVSVYATPALIPTAAVGVNPWDSVFGPINSGMAANVAALAANPQVSDVSMS